MFSKWRRPVSPFGLGLLFMSETVLIIHCVVYGTCTRSAYPLQLIDSGPPGGRFAIFLSVIVQFWKHKSGVFPPEFCLSCRPAGL